MATCLAATSADSPPELRGSRQGDDGGAESRPGADSSPIHVLLDGGGPYAPGSFATWSYRIINEGSEACDLQVSLTVPADWAPVDSSRVLFLESWSEATTPFTVWIPPQTSAGEAHAVALSARLIPSGALAGSIRHTIRIAPVRRVLLSPRRGSAEDAGAAHPRFRFVLRNAGNQADEYRITAQLTPDWKCPLSTRSFALGPGESVEFTASVEPPPSAANGTVYILDVTAASTTKEGAGSPGSGSATAQVMSTLHREPRVERQHRSLPLQAQAWWGHDAGGDDSQGLRLESHGPISPRVSADLEADLRDGTGPSSPDWTDERLYFGLAGESWEAAVGDVTREFPEVITQTLSGRGASLRTGADEWRTRFFGGKSRDVSRSATWGIGADHPVTGDLRIGADFVRADLRQAAGARRVDLGCVTGSWEDSARTRAKVETAWSRSVGSAGGVNGSAAELFLDHSGKIFRCARAPTPELPTSAADPATRTESSPTSATAPPPRSSSGRASKAWAEAPEIRPHPCFNVPPDTAPARVSPPSLTPRWRRRWGATARGTAGPAVPAAPGRRTSA